MMKLPAARAFMQGPGQPVVGGEGVCAAVRCGRHSGSVSSPAGRLAAGRRGPCTAVLFLSGRFTYFFFSEKTKRSPPSFLFSTVMSPP